MINVIVCSLDGYKKSFITSQTSVLFLHVNDPSPQETDQLNCRFIDNTRGDLYDSMIGVSNVSALCSAEKRSSYHQCTLLQEGQVLIHTEDLGYAMRKGMGDWCFRNPSKTLSQQLRLYQGKAASPVSYEEGLHLKLRLD